MSHEVKRIRAIGDTYIYVSPIPHGYGAYLCVEQEGVVDTLYYGDRGSMTATGNSVEKCVANLMFKIICLTR